MVVRKQDALLRSYISGDVPPVGSTGYARIGKVLTFRDDVLVPGTKGASEA